MKKVSNHGSIPITIDCNVVDFIGFEEGFHQPVKAHQTVSFSGCNGVSTCTCGLASLQMRQFCFGNVATALNPHSDKYKDENAIRNVEQSTIILDVVAKSNSAAKNLGSDPLN
ncbi:hypothetical protein TNCV_354861 [Trichonephila clavipes]|uniref:Uncharacterized protein n=1 Tax=Trichonephila clavipes TaxID=2585209 RepID=A0A8X6W178_TRICX|nr:hypothetical protein TNCV_354861 [Trichonephila clavipes]